MIKAIIFDFDGTLADTYKIVLDAVNQLAPSYNYKPLKDSPYLRSKSMKEIVSKDLRISVFLLGIYIRKLKAIISRRINEAKIFPEFKKIIKLLSKKYNLIILTTNSEETVRSLLGKEYAELFDYIYSNSSVFGKSHLLLKYLADFEPVLLIVQTPG